MDMTTAFAEAEHADAEHACPAEAAPQTAAAPVTLHRRWPKEGHTRVPLWIYTDPEILRKEMSVFFGGDTWNYVGLECELPDVGSFKRTWIGDKQVIVVRDADGINVVENRCAHRGGAICWKNKGEVKDLTCPYHQWSYNLKGDLIGVPFKRGVHGEGGMPKGFNNKDHGLRKLRVTRFNGSIWATFSDTTPDFETYCGPELTQRLRRMMPGRPLRVLGYSRQIISCNWKLYFENTRDPYHGTLLHTFFISFGLYRADSRHYTLPVAEGRHMATYAVPADRTEGADVTKELTRFRGDLQLQDPEMVRFVDEYGDGQMSALQIFPSTFAQQHANILAMRSVVPKSTGEVELDWTYFGYADDNEDMQRIRLKQANLLGPSGFVSMDDSELLKQMHNQMVGYPDAESFIEMGGVGVEPQVTMATEVGIRAFYEFYRKQMGL